MNIEIYVLCHQEAKVIPYFMRHYNQYGQVFLMEGHSTDGSVELAESLGAIHVPLDTNNEVNDDIFTSAKNNCWKQSKADWVIICDMDEYIYHRNLVEYLETLEDTTVIIPQNYEMFSRQFPTTLGQIYEEVTMGVKHSFQTNCKMFMFKPQELTEIGYQAGAHVAQPKGNVNINVYTEIISMHMHHISVDYLVERNAYLYGRMSEVNKKYKWGYHTAAQKTEIENWYKKWEPHLERVIIG